MMQRSLLSQRQAFRWSTAFFSANRNPEPLATNDNYFDKEKRSSDVPDKSEEAPWFLRAFASKTRKSLDLYRLNPKYFTMFKFRQWKTKMLRESEIMAQSYLENRHSILGSDLATAHFVVFRGGKVKFVGQKEWIQLNEKTKTCNELPRKLTPNWFLEAVDASGTEIRYEGLVNFIKLSQIRWLSFKNCPHVDNWFVDRITGELGAKLEYLDLSGCTQLTEEVLSCMYRCSNLKTLVLEDVVTTPLFQLTCLLLEDSIPGLTVTGVNYIELPSQSIKNP